MPRRIEIFVPDKANRDPKCWTCGNYADFYHGPADCPLPICDAHYREIVVLPGPLGRLVDPNNLGDTIPT